MTSVVNFLVMVKSAYQHTCFEPSISVELPFGSWYFDQLHILWGVKFHFPKSGHSTIPQKSNYLFGKLYKMGFPLIVKELHLFLGLLQCVFCAISMRKSCSFSQDVCRFGSPLGARPATGTDDNLNGGWLLGLWNNLTWGGYLAGTTGVRHYFFGGQTRFDCDSLHYLSNLGAMVTNCKEKGDEITTFLACYT